MQSAGSDWVLKIGPLYRQNVAGSKEQAESGVVTKLNEAAAPMLKAVQPLQPELLKGVICASGCAAPALAEVAPIVEVFTFQLPNGDWLAQGVIEGFGYKVVCKKS